MYKKLFLLVTLVSLAVFLSSSGLAAPKKMRLTHQFPESHFVAQVAKQFAEDVNQKTGGSVVVEVYPAAQAYKPKEVIKAVISGAIEAGMTTNMRWSGIIPVMDLFVVPYLITDYEVVKNVLYGSVGESLFGLMAKKGVKPLMWTFQTRTMIYTSNEKNLKMPEDFKGKKMRGTSKIMNKGVEALGASPVSVSGPEVYMALQRGTLDIGLTDVSAALARHYYEVQKYGTIANSFAVTFVAFMNPKFWESLSSDEQSAVMAAAKKAQDRCLEQSEVAAKKSTAALKEKGMTLYIQTPEDAKAWENATASVLDYFIKTTGDDGKRLVDKVQKLR
jgi:tripartite ATP-independent transporter DctP family solute receptor